MPWVNGYAICQGMMHMQCAMGQWACRMSGDKGYAVC